MNTTQVDRIASASPASLDECCAQPVVSHTSNDLVDTVQAIGIKPFFASKRGDFVLLEGDCRQLLPHLASGGLRPNTIFADPPYHLSNNGITCQNGRMVSVNKGKWDTSAGVHADHEFIVLWLDECLKSLAKGGCIWVSPQKRLHAARCPSAASHYWMPSQMMIMLGRIAGMSSATACKNSVRKFSTLWCGRSPRRRQT